MRRDTSPLDLTATLRQVRDPVIAVECRTCGRQGTLDRAALVNKQGAAVTFARLRRMAAMGANDWSATTGIDAGRSSRVLIEGHLGKLLGVWS